MFTYTIHRSSVAVLLLLATLLMLPTTAANAAVWYVTPAGAGDQSGTSWATACGTLQAAVDKAASGDEIWVRAGSYTGTGATGVVTLKSGVTLYGGFTGAETVRGDRDYTENVTIMNGEDARRCVYAISGGAVDGFTMTGGKTTSSSTGGTNGGGMFGGTATNCVFTYNTASDGAGLYQGTAVNCLFAYNNAEINGQGGGMYQGTATKCIFRNNSASHYGGGMYQGAAINCIFTLNSSGSYGGGMYQGTAMNCTVAYNSSNNAGSGLRDGTATNCIIWGNTGGFQAYGAIVTYSCLTATQSGTGNIVGEPSFINPSLGDFRLRADSPCIDKGTSSGAPLVDLVGTVRPNGVGIDMGAYEYVPYSVFVPSVEGYPEEAATTAIREADLTLGAVTQTFNNSVPSGNIISQNPAGGAEAVSGSAVALVVSRGPYIVPNVVGQTQSAASTAITNAGLTVGTITEQYHASVASGRVISQDPVSGAQVEPEAAVDLVISKGPQPVPVPDVVGQAQAAATTAITGAGLTLGAVTQEYSISVPSGSVISQTPAAGTMVLPNTTVALVVSKGLCIVPNVVGLSQSAATTAITGAGLVLGTVTEQYHSTVASGRICAQDPAAGTSIAPALAVSIVLSKGPQPILVPNVVGQTRASATTMITGAGLALGTVTEAYSVTVPAGQVISQNPAAGASVPPGSVVALVVSKGPVVMVPNVVGLTQAAAGSAIGGAGLTLGTVTEAHSATVPAGQVISQTPAAGASVPTGSAVNLVVSKGPAPTTVPNVVGMTQAAASSAITAAGFTVGTVTEAYSATVPAGQVISQTPAAGAQAAPGSSVSLVVSKGPDPGEGEGEGEPPLPPTAEEVLALLAAGFNELDTNGDGRISYAEALAAIPRLTLAVFNELDTDGDGALGRAELGLDEEAGCFGCQKSGFTLIDLRKRLGDLFLGGLALSLLAVFGRRKA